MKRLNSLVLLSAGIAAGAAGNYWLTNRPEPVSTPVAAEQSHSAPGDRKILYYRNPMGLPDTSPVPKKDSMGMVYIPVYANETEDPNTVKVSLDKVQRIGVRTEKVSAQPIVKAVRGVATVEHDESPLTVLTVDSERISRRTRPDHFTSASARPSSASLRSLRQPSERLKETPRTPSPDESR
jgi:membrane fusion protein, copper/silver efflux system